MNTIGNILPEDDLNHPPGEAKNFNESRYYNFYDVARSLGGWCRIGNRVHEGYAEMTVCLYLPGGRVLFAFGRPEIHDNEAHDAGGLRFEVLEPGQLLKTVFAGRLVDLADPLVLADPKRAFTENPWVDARFDLRHEAIGPLWGTTREREVTNECDRALMGAFEGMSHAHFQQHMKVTGSLEYAGVRLEIDGLGLRDGSWGPRTWQASAEYEWLTINFGEDFGISVSSNHDESRGFRVVTGYVYEGDVGSRIEQAQIDTDFGENGVYQRSMRARLRADSGREWTVSGEVMGLAPLRNRRGGKVTTIGEGIARFACEGRTGYGMTEYLRQSR